MRYVVSKRTHRRRSCFCYSVVLQSTLACSSLLYGCPYYMYIPHSSVLILRLYYIFITLKIVSNGRCRSQLYLYLVWEAFFPKHMSTLGKNWVFVTQHWQMGAWMKWSFSTYSARTNRSLNAVNICNTRRPYHVCFP